MSPACAPAQDLPTGIGEINRTCFRGEQSHDLPQREVQDFVEIERLRGDGGNCVKSVQFAVAATNFVVRSALFRSVHQEPLITLKAAFGIPRGKTAFHRVQDCAVFATEGNLKVANVTSRL